ncbi:MAG TPA: universal stress protein [Rhodocyclaceae bacterium]|jgi:nucleotide-binding universal stress UspA family protein|nr:universal stress protein [Rhodocyclaceae bacterium]
MFKHLLVPTDGSELSDKTVASAAQFAAEIGARVTLLYVRPDYPVSYFGEGALVDPSTPENFAEMTQKVASEILTRSQAVVETKHVTCTTHAIINDLPWEGIIATAESERCDLIFMASHGRRGLASLLLGSETQKVLTHSAIPVLVYRMQETT